MRSHQSLGFFEFLSSVNWGAVASTATGVGLEVLKLRQQVKAQKDRLKAEQAMQARALADQAAMQDALQSGRALPSVSPQFGLQSGRAVSPAPSGRWMLPVTVAASAVLVTVLLSGNRRR